jgi:peptidoglycan/LPS O-acetylase OafA/YrhL
MPPTQPTTKQHYLILDGLRGVAAILVVIFHLFEAYFPDPANNPIHHGYLAVDFFFLLSGFVVGYAYDDRWKRMSTAEFFKIRLTRLHPLVILGVLIGAIAYWFDPYSGVTHVGFLKLMGIMLISFTLLPSPDLHSWGETHSLNGPCWSLLQEYIANIIYAFAGKKIANTILWIIVIISGITLTIVVVRRGDIATGWAYQNFWIAVVRMMFPFFAGLLLFRTARLIRIPMAFPLCALALTVLFLLPTFRYNGWFEAACIIIAFPIIIAAGAGGQISGAWAKLCKFSGAISYPIYITHYPFIYIYINWIVAKKPAPQQIVPVACGLLLFFILLAYAALKLYDEPIRNWLKKKISVKK